jgi:predicted nucleotide-binding protein
MREKLKELIKCAENLRNSSSKSPEFKAWNTDVLRFLIKQYGEESTEAEAFKKLNFLNVAAMLYGRTTSKNAEAFQNDLETAILSLQNYLSDFSEEPTERQSQTNHSGNNKNVFVVHGKNDGIKAQVANLVQKVRLNPIILHEQANEGKTIIEKFEKHTDVKAAIVLFTGDDVGRYKDDAHDEKRPRQNVIFEAGYFMGKLGRKNTIILAEERLNIQSDLQGYIYIPLDEHQRWHIDLARELKTIGFDIDMNDLI